MQKLNNELSELLNTHISVYSELLDKSRFITQLDYLTFWVSDEGYKYNCPFKFDSLRDNPNWELTKYKNVYQFVESDKIVLQYVRDGYSPIAILQWYKMKIKGEEKRKISIYGKGLRLYYLGYLSWLPDYINMYCGEVIRADLCRDSKERLPESVIDLTNTVTYGEGENRTYKGFGNKRSPLFIRIYDKTLDLKKDKNSMAWLYPDWYTKSCWRLECKFTGRYANCLNALQWLNLIDFDTAFIVKKTETKRNYLKSAFYNLLMYVDFIPDKYLQVEILDSVKTLCSRKLEKLKDFISLDCDND